MTHRQRRTRGEGEGWGSVNPHYFDSGDLVHPLTWNSEVLGRQRVFNEKQQSTLHIKSVSKVRTIANIFREAPSTHSMLSEVYMLLRICYTIPMSNTESERSFSALHRLKTYLRSTMTQQRLNHLIFLHVHKDLTNDLDLATVCNNFISCNDRRQAFLWNI